MSKNFPSIALDADTLERLGFVKSGKDHVGHDAWRIKFPYYHFQIQVVLGDYPKSNPNCGIVSLYDPPTTLEGYSSSGRKKKIKVRELEQPIAWYVDTPERLRQIIISLTSQNI